jgi:GT2 family glycosyltransferase
MWTVVDGVEPFVWARNANIGLAAAAPHDVLLVNDDVRFTEEGSITRLAAMADGNPDVGVLSPLVIGGVGNPMQRADRYPPAQRRDGGLIFSAVPYLAFVCVYIRRAVLDDVGPFDERFDGYGGDDEDWSLRAAHAGYRLAVAPGVTVVHGHGARRWSSSFARTMGDTSASMAEMRRRLQEKVSCG